MGTKQYRNPLTSIVLTRKNVETVLKISAFMFNRRKEVSQEWNDMMASK